MARGCTNNMTDHNPTQPYSVGCEVPSINIEERGGEGDDDDDDAQVFLQHLTNNFGITARSRASRKSITLSKEHSRSGSALSSAVSRQKSTRTLVEVTTRLTHANEGQLYRLLSAKRNHIQDLSSDVIFLHNRIKELEEQNRLLVRMGKRQEAALARYQDAKSELPHIIEAHKIEINVLQEKLRRSTEVNRRNTEKLKVTDNRIIKLTDEVTRLRELSRKRNLPEREELNKKLSAASKILQDKEKELEEAQHRLIVIEKSLKQQVQAEVARHRATARKLYNLQCQHNKLHDTLMERERELEALEQYQSRGERGDSSSTTAASSRSGSLSARHKSGRKRGSGSSDTTTSGIISAIDVSSTSDSRTSLALDASGRLPPISSDGRRRQDAAGSSIIPGSSVSPEVLARPTRQRPNPNTKENGEGRRMGAARRNCRSPRSSVEDGFLMTPHGSPTPSPSTTPEPQAHRSQFEQDGLNSVVRHPGHTDHRRRQRLAASLRDARLNVRKESDNEERSPSGAREFSLIEHYPPRERVTLNGGSSGGSDAGSGSPPTPTHPVAPHADTRLSHLDSSLPDPPLTKRETTLTSDLRTFSSLSKLDSTSSPKPTRSAITP